MTTDVKQGQCQDGKEGRKKGRGEVGERNEWRVASGEWRVASGEWRVASGEWRVASGEWRVASGEKSLIANNIVATFPTEFTY
ncbi:hypothetical protein [Photobacterium aquimaris]|uniref:hypothetical protein n=1 Tax=Photobacterium aquimaris TaxID=512643 RepID=UPI0011B2093B|nr:hypothetical protein [Photobacterium aquimaris]